jgi:hypothetical protein
MQPQLHQLLLRVARALIPQHGVVPMWRRQRRPANARSHCYNAGGFLASSTTCRVGLRLNFRLQLQHLCFARLPAHYQLLWVPCLPQQYAPVEKPE